MWNIVNPLTIKRLYPVGMAAAFTVLVGCQGAPTGNEGNASSSSGQASNSSSSSSSGSNQSPDPLAEIKFATLPGTNISAPQTSCATVQATPEALLSKSQYINAVRDIYAPLDINVASSLESVRFPKSFDDAFVKGLEKAANTAAEQIVNNFSSLGLGCDANRACAKAYVEKFGRRALRGTLTAEEVEEMLTAIYDPENDFNEGIAQLTRVLMMHPNTLYRFEEGVQASTGAVALSAIDKASKLSLLLWNTIPDDELLDAAENGSLATESGFKSQVSRMIQDQKLNDSISDFHHHWLELQLGSTSPTFDSAVHELDLLVPKLFRNGKIDDMFTTKTAMVNKELADVYGVDATGLTNDTWKEVTVDNRPGLITRAAFLLATSHDIEKTTPTERGKVIGINFLCQNLPHDAPAEVQNLFPQLPRELGKTTRQELEEVVQVRADCLACHYQTDPLGFALEHFDGSAKFREFEEGVRIDANVLDSTIGPINGAAGYAQVLSESGDAQSCYVANWYKNAFLQNSVATSDCVLQDIQARVNAADGNLIQLITELVNSPALHYRSL